ncbi:MAG: hypothetical protein HY833_00920 [Candidatus Aenigmarchaeota archaeon]|nr:hypothetical protein [Candidatus Aenigmarchaeota archaeon]
MRKDSARSFLVFSAFTVVFLAFFAGQSYADTICRDEVPDVTIYPSSIVSPPGQTAVFTVEVENEDPDSCELKTFNMTGYSSDGFGISLNPSVLYIRPGDSETALMKVSVPSGATSLTYEVSARATGGIYTGIGDAEITVREAIEDCEVRVGNMRFKEKDSDEFKSTFAKDDEVRTYVDVSLLGNSPSKVTLDLYADGNVIESATENYPENSDTTFKFATKVLTKNYNDNINMRVVATAACNPTESDEDEDRVEIEESDDDIEIDFTSNNPPSTVVGREVSARAFVENLGTEDTKVNVDARMCRDAYGCDVEMDCGESVVIVENADAKKHVNEIVCRGIPTLPGKYRVEFTVTFEGDEDHEDTNSFFVYSTDAELAAKRQGLNISYSSPAAAEVAEAVKQVRYVCKGNLRQAIFTTTNGVKVSDIEFCPSGCKDGTCSKKAASKKAELKPSDNGDSEPKPKFSEPRYNPAVFDLDNLLGWLKNLMFSKPS